MTLEALKPSPLTKRSDLNAASAAPSATAQ